MCRKLKQGDVIKSLVDCFRLGKMASPREFREFI